MDDSLIDLMTVWGIARELALSSHIPMDVALQDVLEARARLDALAVTRPPAEPR